MSDRVNNRQTVPTYLEGRDFPQVRAKGPDLDFKCIEVELSKPSKKTASVASSSVKSSKDIRDGFSDADWELCLAENQYMAKAYNNHFQINEAVFEKFDDLVRSSDVESSKRKQKEQQARFQKILIDSGNENYGRYDHDANKKEKTGPPQGAPPSLKNLEATNKAKTGSLDNDVLKIAEGTMYKVPTSAWVGTLIAAGMSFAYIPLLGVFTTIAFLVYLWECLKRTSAHKNEHATTPYQDLNINDPHPRVENDFAHDVVRVNHLDTSTKPISYPLKMFLESPMQKDPHDSDELKDSDSVSSTSVNTRSHAEAMVCDFIANMKMPKVPEFDQMSYLSFTPAEDELDTPVTDRRVFFKIRFDSNSIDHNCLFDPGATSCVISRHTLELEERLCGKRFPRLPREAWVKGIGDEEPRLKMEIVLVKVYVEGIMRSRNAPFLVEDQVHENYDCLVGVNLLSQWGTVWTIDNGQTTLSFKRDCHPNLKVSSTFQKDITKARMSVVKGVTLASMQTKVVPVKIEHPFHKDHGTLVEIKPKLDDLELRSTPFIKDLKRKHFKLKVTNESKKPIHLVEGLEVGSVKVYNSRPLPEEEEVEVNVAETNVDFDYKTSTVSCTCPFRKDREVSLFTFNNEYGENAHYHQIADGTHPLEKWKRFPRVVGFDEHIIDVMQERNGQYYFNYRSIEPKLQKRARVILSFREELTKEMKIYLAKLRRYVDSIEICYVRNTKCIFCGSLANRDNKDLFSNINGVKIYIVGHKQQPYEVWRMADRGSPVEYFYLGGYACIQVFKSNYKLTVVVHMTRWHELQKFRWESTMHLLMTHLRMLKVPPAFSILTTYGDMACTEVKQMMRALFLTKPWEGSNEYDPKVGPDIVRSTLINFHMDICSCDACTAIKNYKYCPVGYYKMLFQGNLGDPKGVAKNTRAHVEEMGPIFSEIGEIMAHILDTTAEVESLPDFGEERQKVLPEEYDDGVSDDGSFVRDDNFVGTIPDGDEILHNFHKTVDWRTIISEDSLPETPENPKVREMLIKILDKRTAVFAANEYEWRWLRVPPVVLHWVNEKESIVDKPTPFSAGRGSQLVDKVLRLLELAMVRIIPRSDGSWIQNVCNSYVVPHSSQTKRDMMTGKIGKTELTEKSNAASTMRLILDLRNANKNLKNAKQNDYMLDSVDTVMSRIAEAKSLSKLDLTKAYRGLPVHEDSMKSLCFRANYGMLKPFLFSFVSLPDGLSICPAVYQTKIEEALLTELNNAIVYIDDIIIFHDTQEQNVETVNRVLKKLDDVGALVNLRKCEFLFKVGEFLGFKIVVTKDGVLYGIPQSKLDVFKKMRCPVEKKELMTYYGMLNFLFANIPGLQAHVEPLTRLLPSKIPKPFAMTEIQQNAFKKLNKTLDKLPMQHLFSYDRTAYLLCDASLTHAGACLLQLNDDKTFRITRFWSKKFDQQTICNSSSIDKEIAAVLMAVSHFEKYLTVVCRTVIITDLAAMISMLSSQVEFKNTKLARHSFKLFNFDFAFQLRHASSRFGAIQDQLSRVFEELVTETGLPVGHKADLDAFFKKWGDTIPQEWKDGAIFKHQDMINHLTDTIMNDPSISKTLKAKRLNGLLEQLNPNHLPDSILFAKKEIDSSVYKSQKVKSKSKDPEIDAFVVEYKREEVIMPNCYNVETEGYAPPRKINTISIAQIVKLQQDDQQCREMIMYIMTTPEEKQDGRVRNKFRVLNGSLLVTRKNRKLPWSNVGNLRVYLGPIPATTIIATLHLIYGHAGENHLELYFNASFKCKNRKEIMKTVIKGCGPCTLYKWNLDKVAPPGRFPLPKSPGDRYHADIVEFDPSTVNGITYKYYLGVIDAYSSLLWLYAVPQQTSYAILKAFEHMFSVWPAPNTLCLDNATYFRSDEFVNGMKNLGVKHIQYSTPNVSTTNSPIENRFSTVRRLVQLNMQSFRNRHRSQVIYATVTQMNVKPLYRLKKYTDRNIPPSAMDLFFALDPRHRSDPISEFVHELEPENQLELRAEYDKMIRDYDNDKAAAHELSIKAMKISEREIKVGSLVLATNWKKRKRQEKGTNSYNKTMYVVLSIHGQRVTLKPLFRSNKHQITTNLNHVKLLKNRKWLSLLPKNLQKFLGHVEYDVKKLKKNKSAPSFFEEGPSVYEAPITRSKREKKEIAEPAFGNELEFSDDEEDDDDDDFDFGYFLQSADESLRLGPSSSAGASGGPPPPPPSQKVPDNFKHYKYVNRGDNSDRFEDALEMQDETDPDQRFDLTPVSQFTRRLIGGQEKLKPQVGVSRDRRLGDQHQFGGPANIQNPLEQRGRSVGFTPTSERRTFGNNSDSTWKRLFNSKKNGHEDRIVETRFHDDQEPQEGLGVRNSSPAQGAIRKVPYPEDSPIASARPRQPLNNSYRENPNNDSSFYEDALEQSLDDTVLRNNEPGNGNVVPTVRSGFIAPGLLAGTMNELDKLNLISRLPNERLERSIDDTRHFVNVDRPNETNVTQNLSRSQTTDPLFMSSRMDNTLDTELLENSRLEKGNESNDRSQPTNNYIWGPDDDDIPDFQSVDDVHNWVQSNRSRARNQNPLEQNRDSFEQTHDPLELTNDPMEQIQNQMEESQNARPRRSNRPKQPPKWLNYSKRGGRNQ